jgi:hypothetical protein
MNTGEHCMRTAYVLAAFLAVVVAPWQARALDPVPPCRLDASSKAIVSETLDRTIRTYHALGKPLPIERVEVNQSTSSDNAKVLNVTIVHDAAQGKVSPQGCATAPIANGEPLDALSVRGGCIVVAVERMEMRCSSRALDIFSYIGQRAGRANPALLYVLAHEFAHIYQRRGGEYAGGVERIELSLERGKKVSALRDACDPVNTRREEEADTIALQVLVDLVAAPPYREPVFSERGSLYWNIDLLALAADAWQRNVLEREFISQPAMHPSFTPTQFPTAERVLAVNARRFVCDVLTKRSGVVLYPGKSATHPPLDQRLRRMAEALRPVAQRLPATGAQEDFAPVARLQQDLGPILTHIYRETGVYLEAVQARICTAVNASNPQAACR